MGREEAKPGKAEVLGSIRAKAVGGEPVGFQTLLQLPDRALRHIPALDVKIFIDRVRRAGEIGDHKPTIGAQGIDFQLGHDTARSLPRTRLVILDDLEASFGLAPATVPMVVLL